MDVQVERRATVFLVFRCVQVLNRVVVGDNGYDVVLFFIILNCLFQQGNPISESVWIGVNLFPSHQFQQFCPFVLVIGDLVFLEVLQTVLFFV